MARFIRFEQDGDALLLNVESIAWVHPASLTVCTSGVDGAGKGLAHLEPDNIKQLIKTITDGSDDAQM